MPISIVRHLRSSARKKNRNLFDLVWSKYSQTYLMTKWPSVHASIILPSSQSYIHPSIPLSTWLLSGYWELIVCQSCAKFFTPSLFIFLLLFPPFPPFLLLLFFFFFIIIILILHLNKYPMLALCQALSQFHHMCSLCLPFLYLISTFSSISYITDKKVEALRGKVTTKEIKLVNDRL